MEQKSKHGGKTEEGKRRRAPKTFGKRRDPDTVHPSGNWFIPFLAQKNTKHFRSFEKHTSDKPMPFLKSFSLLSLSFFLLRERQQKRQRRSLSLIFSFERNQEPFSPLSFESGSKGSEEAFSILSSSSSSGPPRFEKKKPVSLTHPLSLSSSLRLQFKQNNRSPTSTPRSSSPTRPRWAR